jgi:aminobenzoyl-glutamate utilization protein B
MPTTKADILMWLDYYSSDFTHISDAIWAKPELEHREFFASKLQSGYLEKEGSHISRDIGGLRTAFFAEWGRGNQLQATGPVQLCVQVTQAYFT